jgi:hypothetical protein
VDFIFIFQFCDIENLAKSPPQEEGKKEIKTLAKFCQFCTTFIIKKSKKITLFLLKRITYFCSKKTTLIQSELVPKLCGLVETKWIV